MICVNPECNNEFNSYKGFQKYCSRRCEKRVYYLNHREATLKRVKEYRKTHKIKRKYDPVKTKAYREKNKERDREKKVRYNREYRIRVGLKGKSVSLYYYCDFCDEEHIKNSKTSYLWWRHSRGDKIKTANFVCKKKTDKLNNEWTKSNPTKRKVIANRHHKKQVESLSNSYIKEKLSQSGFHLIPENLIELKRIHLKGLRIIKQKQL